MAALVAGGLGMHSMLQEHRHRLQMQTDPRVATAWTIGTTVGKTHTLTRGTPLQAWLNARGIHLFGDYSVLRSRFGGDPGGVEIWFDYDSYVPNQGELECHRIGDTAFVDDLGQPYHGFLDFQGKVVGVYLPGYDHAARRLTCALHWMPRQPASPQPVSMPMYFTIDLPPARRALPFAGSLPPGPISVTKQGITVTAGAAALSAPNLSSYRATQRELTFRLKIEGGELADANVEARPPMTALQADYRMARLLGVKVRMPLPIRVSPSDSPTHQRFVITDPYGVSLLPERETLTPMMKLDMTGFLRDSNGTIWVAPVNGAGRGTDAIRLRFDVRPAAPRNASTLPFDIILPVQTDDEV